jgi:hypothetical protein
VRGEEYGVVEGVLYSAQDVAHLAVAVECGGVGKGILDDFDHFLGDFEVDLGFLAEFVDVGRCHAATIRDEGVKWNSLTATKGTLEG